MSATATPQQKPQSGQAIGSGIVILILFGISIAIYQFILGSPANFEGGNPENEPVMEGIGKWLGTVYKGGPIVPVLMTCFLTVLSFSLERLISLSKASGSGSVDLFVRNVKSNLYANNINGAIELCNKQKGSVGNVIQSVLGKYDEIYNDHEMNKDQKILAIQKELEDATTLELPMLERNLPIIATLASVATLIGLLGTVLGMIKAFAALAGEGGTDSKALAVGISEALINTALGIGTSAVAIVAYNFFTSKIDGLTYAIDEAGFSIMQNFGQKTK